MAKMGTAELYRSFGPNHTFDFDPYIDLDALKRLEIPTTIGIARASWQVGQIGRGHTKENRCDLHEEYENYTRLADDNPIKQATEKLTYREKRIFLALHTRCLTLGFSITLRTQDDFFQNKPDDPFNILNITETGNAKYFPELLSFIDNLEIFEAIGRVNLFITPPNSGGEIHRDYNRDRPGPRQIPQFIWFRFHLLKPFFLFDIHENRKRYVSSHACWFNSNQYHGTDPVDFFTYSVRVDGKFKENISRLIGFV